jgi:hypothetical protein
LLLSSVHKDLSKLRRDSLSGLRSDRAISLIIQIERFSSVQRRIIRTFGMDHRTPDFAIQIWMPFHSFLNSRRQQLLTADAINDASASFEYNIASGNVMIDGNQLTCSIGT